jgi:hypothetical protein
MARPVGGVSASVEVLDQSLVLRAHIVNVLPIENGD